MYADIRYQVLQKLGVIAFPTVVYPDFKTAIHNAVTTL